MIVAMEIDEAKALTDARRAPLVIDDGHDGLLAGVAEVTPIDLAFGIVKIEWVIGPHTPGAAECRN